MTYRQQRIFSLFAVARWVEQAKRQLHFLLRRSHRQTAVRTRCGNCYSGTISANRDRLNLLHLRPRLRAQLDKNTVIFHNKAAIYQEGTSYNTLKKNRGGRRQSKEPKTGASASSSPRCSSSSDSPKRFDALLIIRAKGHARVRAKGGERERLVF